MSPPPESSDRPLAQSLEELMDRRRIAPGTLSALLRAEGIAISRTRLHQLCSGTGAPPTREQMERLATVLGTDPGYFAEYRLMEARRLLDPTEVGFDDAMRNLSRLRRRAPLLLGAARGTTGRPDGRYPQRSSTGQE